MQNNVGMDPMNQYRGHEPPPGMNNNNNDGPPHNSDDPASGPPESKMYAPGHPQQDGAPMGHPYPGSPYPQHPGPRGNYHHGEMDHMNQMRHGYKPMPPRGPMYPQQRFISGEMDNSLLSYYLCRPIHHVIGQNSELETYYINLTYLS